jgi:hypothetical protein
MPSGFDLGGAGLAVVGALVILWGNA